MPTETGTVLICIHPYCWRTCGVKIYSKMVGVGGGIATVSRGHAYSHGHANRSQINRRLVKTDKWTLKANSSFFFSLKKYVCHLWSKQCRGFIGTVSPWWLTLSDLHFSPWWCQIFCGQSEMLRAKLNSPSSRGPELEHILFWYPIDNGLASNNITDNNYPQIILFRYSFTS